MAKRKRRQAERKWRYIKLTIFKDLYGQAKHKVSKLVHTAKCKFYTERIALASSSKELYQMWTIGVGVRMSTLNSNVAGSIPASICFLLEQETLSALLQSTQL